MANSTLSPGRPSVAIVRLREAALKEMDAPDVNIRSARIPEFDQAHRSTNEDDSLAMPQFHGTDNPHVGNGHGPIG
jgi:hypothetical protein